MPKEASEEGEDNRQPFPVLTKTILDIVHGTADPFANLVALAVLDGQGDLGVLGTHTHQGGNPHPEHSAGAADSDSAGNTGDVTGTNGSRQSGTHGLKGGNRTSLGLALGLLQGLAQGVLHNIAQLGKLREFAQNAQQHARAQNQHHGRDTPDDVVDGTLNTIRAQQTAYADALRIQSA